VTEEVISHKLKRPHEPLDKGEAQPEKPSFLEQVYKQHWRNLIGYLYTKYGSGPPDPEDVAQATFVKFAKLDDPFSIKNPKAFLYRVARNITVDSQRKRQTHTSYAQSEVLWQADSMVDDLTAENVLLEKERLQIFEKTIEKLPTERRKLLIMNRVHNLSYAEIARRTNIPVTTVKRHVALAMANCVEAMVNTYNDKVSDE